MIRNTTKLAMKTLNLRQAFNKLSVRCCSSETQLVNVDVNEKTGIAIVTMNRKPVNSLSLELFAALSNTLDDLESNKSRGMILTSSCETVFSAGLDLNELHNPDLSRFREFWTSFQNVWLKLYGSSFPTAAAINGHAPAGGCFLAISCEYRVMCPDYIIGLNETRLGIIAPPFLRASMRNTLSNRDAERALTLGTLFNTEEALKIGLIDEIAIDKAKAIEMCENFLVQFRKVSSVARAVTKKSFRRKDLEELEDSREEDLQKKYKVYFYGTGEVANLKVEDCFDYLETKEKFANEKCLKRANFQTAVDQIEQSIANGDDAAPIDFDISTVSSVKLENTSTNVTIPTEDENDELSGTPQVAQTVNVKTSVKPKAKITPKQTTSTPRSTFSNSKFVPNKISARKVPSEKVAILKAVETLATTPPPAAAITTTPTAAAAITEEPVISRSGRKIKPKRYLHEEFEEEIHPPKRKAPNVEYNVLSMDSKIDIVVKTEAPVEIVEEKNIAEQIEFAVTTTSIEDVEKDTSIEERKNTVLESNPDNVSENAPTTNDEESNLNNIKNNDLLLALTPKGDCVGIKPKNDIPESFENAQMHQSWLKEAAMRALDLKSKIENNVCTTESAKDMIEMKPKISPEITKKLESESNADDACAKRGNPDSFERVQMHQDWLKDAAMRALRLKSNIEVTKDFIDIKRNPPQITKKLESESRPEITKKFEPESLPEITKKLESESRPEITKEFEPDSRPEITKKLESESRPEITRKLESESRPEITRKLESESRPEITKKLEPESRPEITKKVEPESRPEITKKVESEIRPEITKKLESQRRLETTVQLESQRRPEITMKLESQRRLETTVKLESQRRPEITMKLESQRVPDITKKIESEIRPEITKKLEPESRPEITKKVESEIRPEITKKLESQRRLETTVQLESQRRPEINMKLESQRRLETTMQLESQRRLETTKKLESQRVPEITKKLEPEIRPEITKKLESESRPEITKKLEPESRPEITKKVESEIRPEITKKLESQRRLETTVQLESQRRLETTKKLESQRVPEITKKLEPEIRPEITKKLESQRRLETTVQLESQRRPEITMKLESQRRLETTVQLESQRRLETTKKLESQRVPEITKKLEPEIRLEITKKLESQRRPEITKKLEPEIRPEITKKLEPEVRPEITKKLESQRRLETTVKLESQRRPEITKKLQPEIRPEITKKLESQRRPEITKKLQPEIRPEITKKLESQRRPEITKKLESEIRPEITKKLESESRADVCVTERDKKILIENSLLEHDHLIKSCIQLTSADIDRTIELLKRFKEIKYTKFMLKKHPIVVETMKRLRIYVGNTKNWGFSDEQKEEFDEKAVKVRCLAENIYNSFKSFFTIPDGKAFLDILNEEVRIFKEKVSNMTSEELVFYVEEEGNP